MIDPAGRRARETAVSLYYGHTGIRLANTAYTDHMLVDREDRRGYALWLLGPYRDRANPDVRLFLWYREIDEMATVTAMVQDHDDDAVLNSSHSSAIMVTHSERPILDYQAGHAFYLGTRSVAP